MTTAAVVWTSGRALFSPGCRTRTSLILDDKDSSDIARIAQERTAMKSITDPINMLKPKQRLDAAEALPVTDIQGAK